MGQLDRKRAVPLRGATHGPSARPSPRHPDQNAGLLNRGFEPTVLVFAQRPEPVVEQERPPARVGHLPESLDLAASAAA
jgi:hypothetical protein